jgi:murein DD-endopeptidase MepM/ murein hydrolase activator NlpD
MRSHTVLLAILALAFSARAHACELPAATAQAPLQTRKPVVGDQVRLTSGFGMRYHPLLREKRLHTGVDWAAPSGTQVVAAGAGRVVFAETKGDYGNLVVLDHGGGWQTAYAQLSAFDVKAGDCVEYGSPIGKVGSTGRSAGPHLHFEVSRNGQPLDPMVVQTVRKEP